MPTNPLFNIIYGLRSQDEIIISGSDITGIIINSSNNTSFIGPGITNPHNVLEVRVAPSVNLQLGGLSGDLSNILIIGEGNNITLSPSTNRATISLQGDINFCTDAMAGTTNTYVFNLVNTVSLNIPTLSYRSTLYLDLTDVSGYAQIVSRGVTILASAQVGYLVGLTEGQFSQVLDFVLTPVPGHIGLFPFMSPPIQPGTKIRITPNRNFETLETP